MKYLLGIAMVLLATSATVNAYTYYDLHPSFYELWRKWRDFFSNSNTDWVDSWVKKSKAAAFEKTFDKFNDNFKQRVFKLFEGNEGRAFITKLQEFYNEGYKGNDEDFMKFLARVKRYGLNGSAPLPFSGFLVAAMMFLFILF